MNKLEVQIIIDELIDFLLDNCEGHMNFNKQKAILSYINKQYKSRVQDYGKFFDYSYVIEKVQYKSIKDISEEDALNALIEKDVDIVDIETSDGMTVVYGKPNDLFKIKEAISSIKDVEFELDEIVMLPKEKISLQGDDLEIFKRMNTMLDEIEDVQNIYHNVEI